MGEFDLIRRLADATRRAAGPLASAAVVGIGDDAAVIEVDPGEQLVVTTDTLVLGVHFAPDVSAEDLGFKSLAVNLSDLAAMGAEPAWHLLNLSGAEPGGDWVERFASGMGELAGRSGSLLVGGDITSGPLSVTVTAIGRIPRGQALLRSGARPGDLVAVSGEPGLAAAALAAGRIGTDERAQDRLLRPEPRLALGLALRGRATACIDVSDGLAADLGHVLAASGVGAELWLDRLPAGRVLAGLDEEERWNLQLGGGDDYELCFTIPPEAANSVADLAGSIGVPLTVIGRVGPGGALRCFRPDGSAFEPRKTGWDHYA